MSIGLGQERPDTCSNTILGVSVRMLLGEINLYWETELSRLLFLRVSPMVGLIESAEDLNRIKMLLLP